MKKLLTAFALLSLALIVSCGKKNNNSATTPNDCLQYGMNPAYYQNHQWVNNGWNNGGWGSGYNNGQQWGGNQWGNQAPWNNVNNGGFNPYAVGCMGFNNQFPTQNWNGSPYYAVQGEPCIINTSANTCRTPGMVCYPTQTPMFRPGFQFGFQASWQFGGYNPYNSYGQPAYYNGICRQVVP